MGSLHPFWSWFGDFLQSIGYLVSIASAVAVAIYSGLLWKVTNQQRQLLEQSNKATFEMERGVVAAVSCNILSGTCFLVLKNTGRTHIYINRVCYMHFDLAHKPPPDEDWPKGASANFSTNVIAPGEVLLDPYELHLPQNSWAAANAVKDLFYLGFKVFYDTLGVGREAQFAWVFNNVTGSPVDTVAGQRYAGLGYTHDIPGQPPPVD